VRGGNEKQIASRQLTKPAEKVMSESNEQKTITLYVYENEGLSLKNALIACQDVLTKDNSPAVAMLYATRGCHFARLGDKGQLLDKSGKPIELNSTYEARVFSDQAELRWLHVAAGDGSAAVLTEEKNAPNGWSNPKIIVAVGKIPQSYLLWGESLSDKMNSDWIKMATPRIGHYFAPVKSNTATKARVRLNAREYLRQDEKHGNVFVAEERWLNLSIANS
jgi:CRISPR-associated protein (TIGR03984 family)